MFEQNALDFATPDRVIDLKQFRAAIYELDLSAVTAATAPLLISHTYGRVGAAYKALPDLAHYLNVYVGSGLAPEVKEILFPELGNAAQSMSVQSVPPAPFERAHGVLPMRADEAAQLLAACPVPLELFAIGPAERPVERHGFSLTKSDCVRFREFLDSRRALDGALWLTPQPQAGSLGSKIAGWFGRGP